MILVEKKLPFVKEKKFAENFRGKSLVNPIMPSIHKFVKHMLKILQLILQDFKHMFDHFMDTRVNQSSFIACPNLFPVIKRLSRHIVGVSGCLHELISFKVLLFLRLPQQVRYFQTEGFRELFYFRHQHYLKKIKSEISNLCKLITSLVPPKYFTNFLSKFKLFSVRKQNPKCSQPFVLLRA